MTRESAIKHKEVIKAFIEGKDIEVMHEEDTIWSPDETPTFAYIHKYRVKPAVHMLQSKWDMLRDCEHNLIEYWDYVSREWRQSSDHELDINTEYRILNLIE